MKIRRILATAVAAAVTTPVVFLSAAPAFADTKPSPASTQKPATDDEDEKPSYEELEKAVADAEAKLKDLKAQRKAVLKDVDENNIDEALKTELAAATAAAEAAKTAKATADAALVTAEADLAKLKETGSTATPEEIATAEQAVTTAKTAAEAAATTKAAADLRLVNADDAFDDAHVALARKAHLLGVDILVAEQDLADAEEALEAFEEGLGDCYEDGGVKVALNGPKSVTMRRHRDLLAARQQHLRPDPRRGPGPPLRRGPARRGGGPRRRVGLQGVHLHRVVLRRRPGVDADHRGARRHRDR